MKPFMRAVSAAALLTAAACGRPAEAPAPKTAEPAAKPASAAGLPAGAYKVDPTHTSVLFSLNHLGFSNYVGRFDEAAIDLQLDPANPAAAQVSVIIDPASLGVHAPPAGFLEELKGPQWLDAAKFPAISFKSTAVRMTGPDTADVTGDLTLHGVARPMVLKVKFNGGYPGHPMDPNARIGFSATGTFKRSDYGVAYGIPAPGTTLGVSDAVQVMVETELTGPPLPGASPAPAR